MSITSLNFLVFMMVVIIVYYALPKRFQWGILLGASAVFYCSFGLKSVIYVIITATSIYFATWRMQEITDRQKAYLKKNKELLSREEKKSYKARNKTVRKRIMICTILLNIGILCIFKYFHFALEQINMVFSLFGAHQINDVYKFIVPLGISFYTFQSIGYLADVYWENCTAEKKYFKVLLFVSFFPQMTQGPISDFEHLSQELFKEHTFEYKNYSWGVQRMIWGFMKKMVIADTLASCVEDVFLNYSHYSGITTLIGAFMYSIQIYADFSGYMDIVCGFCEILGIRLTENFERPYFSKSIAEYWRRWHISLGTWFKKYIYYPIGMSSWNRKLAKFSKQHFGKRFGDTVPATVALVIVWTTTGLWHGATWAYIVWGFVNGLFIIFSLWMEPVYAGWKQTLHINESSWGWRAFQTIRTFILVTFIKVLPEVGTLSEGLGLWKQIFTNHQIPKSFSELLPFFSYKLGLLTVVLCVGLVFVTSLIQRKMPVRAWLEQKTIFPVRILAYCVLFFLILYFGVPASGEVGGFMYAQF